MKFKCVLSSLMLLLSLNVAADASWEEAAAVVETSIDKMLVKVAPYHGKVSVDLEPLYSDLAIITKQNVDYLYISKVVMGKYYRRASASQKIEFGKVFKRTLLKTYGKTLVSFNVDKYKLVKPRSASPKPDKQKVVVKVFSSKGKSYSLINYMVKKEGSWKLVNIVLDGFNLRVTFKNQFANIAQQSKGNMAVAIAKWTSLMAKK